MLCDLASSQQIRRRGSAPRFHRMRRLGHLRSPSRHTHVTSVAARWRELRALTVGMAVPVPDFRLLPCRWDRRTVPAPADARSRVPMSVARLFNRDRNNCRSVVEVSTAAAQLFPSKGALRILRIYVGGRYGASPCVPAVPLLVPARLGHNVRTETNFIPVEALKRSGLTRRSGCRWNTRRARCGGAAAVPASERTALNSTDCGSTTISLIWPAV
jgi:hypothetical protein